MGSTRLSTSDHYHPPGTDSHCSHTKRPRDHLRVSFDTSIGAEVKCFPSSGGVYVHRCSPMELDFLNLPRCDTVPPSSDPAVEDTFCARLQLLGAEWFPSMADKHEHDDDKIFKVKVPPLAKGEDDIHFLALVLREACGSSPSIDWKAWERG